MTRQIFIDFDDVLIDTKRLKNDYFKAFGRFGVSAKDAISSYMEVIHKFKGYKIKDHLSFLKKRYPALLIKDAERDLAGFFKDSGKYVFHDAVGFLGKFRGLGYKIALVSSGDLRLQADKIKGSGLQDLFHKIKIIKDYHKSSSLRLLGARDRFVFMDDKAEIIDDVKINFPEALALQILRHKDQARAGRADAFPRNLKQAEKYILNYVEK